MRRRAWLAFALGGPLLRSSGLAGPEDRLHGPGAVRLLANVTRNYRLLESTTPSRELITPVQAHLALARGQVGQWEEEWGEVRLAYAMASEIAGLTAWLHADLGDVGTAREHYRLAIHFAQQSEHPLLIPYMMASLGHFAAECGDARQALALVQQARTHLPLHAPASAVAWLSSIQAIAHATAGDRRSATAALLTAERHLAPQHEIAPLAWPWVLPFTFAKASMYRVTCAAELGDAVEVVRAFRDAQPALQAPKRRALVLVDVARAHARRGELDQACRLATDALAIGERAGSERIVQLVGRFRNGLGTGRHRMTAELDDRLAQVYG